MHYNGLKLSVVLEEFSITSQYLGTKMPKRFEKNKRFECNFLTNSSTGDCKRA